MRKFRYRSGADFLQAQKDMLGQDNAKKQMWRDAWIKAAGPDQ